VREGFSRTGSITHSLNWLDIGPGRAVMSYYSAHEHKMDEPPDRDDLFEGDAAHAEHSTAADIFLADIAYAL